MTDTIPEAVRRAATTFARHEAVLDRDTRTDYHDFAAGVRQAAAALVAQGVGPGDRVCVWAPNRIEWMLAALGAQYVGAVLVPLNTRYRGQEAVDVLARARVRVLFVDQGFLGTDHLGLLRSAAGEGPGAPIAGLPDLTTVVTLDEPADGCVLWTDFLASADGVPAERVEALADAVGPDDPADILFTSGTTGRSKGAVSTHRRTMSNALIWAELAEVTPDDRYLIVNPFFHSFGYKAGFLVCLLTGATIVPQAVFDPKRALDLIDGERITLLPGAPAIYQSILDDPTVGDHDLSSLRLAVTGAATVPETLVRRTRSELGFRTVLTAYGLTEAPVATMSVKEDDDETVARTCGRPVAGTEIRTIDADGAPTPAGVPGEVLIRGPQVMLGYLDDPESTAAAIDADGWLHTGDVGVVNERGYLKITDRIKDMFTVGGFNVYPAEIEHVLAAHDSVLESAVVGVPDHRLGEVGRAFVLPRRGASVDPEELIAYCKERLANYKVPRSVVVVDELPRNASGKVLKTDLRVHQAAER
jgi:acyl-CoA synthetase (AMP-forming)/AMP-acid ligase II